MKLVSLMEHLVPADSCALCGQPERRVLFQDGRFTVVRCESCSLVYPTPRLPNELLADVYSQEYWTSDSPSERGYANYAGDAELYRKTFRHRYRLVRQFCSPPGHALDVGCAAGFFLEVLEQSGWRVSGLEISESIAAKPAERFDLHTGSLQGAPWERESFDLVSLWDVIEHVDEPVDFLRRTVSLLKPGGHLVLETQNVESWFARLLGKRWHHFKHIEHLHHFSPKTLQRLLAEVGLRLLIMTPRYAGKYVSFGFVRERAQRLPSWVAALLSPLSFLDQVSMYINPRDELIVVAEKPS